MELNFRRVTQEELTAVHKLEHQSFPEDEADSLDVFIYRWREAPDLTLANFHGDEMIGFICGTRYDGDSFTNECMKKHVTNGRSVCIHSVVVKSEYRRKGIALQMLNKYIQIVSKEQKGALQTLLICKSNHIPLYTRAGFILRGKWRGPMVRTSVSAHWI